MLLFGKGRLQDQDGAARHCACAPVVLVFLLVFPVFCFVNMISFTREELLNIQQNTPQNLLPVFEYSDVLLNVVVGGAVALIKRSGHADGGSKPARS